MWIHDFLPSCARVGLPLVALVALSFLACSRRSAPPPAHGGSAAGQSSPAEGSVGPESTPAATRPGCQANFEDMDSNRDGRLTRQEFMAFPHRIPDPERVFAERDTNGDGALTLSEFCSGAGRGRGRGRMGMQGGGMGTQGGGMGMQGGGMGMGRAGGGPGMGGMHRAMARHMMLCAAEHSNLDADRSERISRAEFGALFDQLDGDRDGELSRAELCGFAGAPPAPTSRPAPAPAPAPQGGP